MKDELIKFIKFNAVGLINTAVDFAVYELLILLGLHYVPAQILSYICGMANSYLLNSRWTFRDKNDSTGRIAAFIAVNLVALGVSIGVQTLVLHLISPSETVAKLISLPFSLGVNFIGNRLFIFNKKDQSK